MKKNITARFFHLRLFLIAAACDGEDLGVEVRGEDGCYGFFEGGYFCFYGFVFF